MTITRKDSSSTSVFHWVGLYNPWTRCFFAKVLYFFFFSSSSFFSTLLSPSILWQVFSSAHSIFPLIEFVKIKDDFSVQCFHWWSYTTPSIQPLLGKHLNLIPMSSNVLELKFEGKKPNKRTIHWRTWWHRFYFLLIYRVIVSVMNTLYEQRIISLEEIQ